MKPISLRICVLVVAAIVLLACRGKPLSEQERSYAEACVKVNNKLITKLEDSRKFCECAATIVVPKLTPGELNAYIASPDLMGKPMTQESVAPLGFTLQDFTNLGVKRQGLFAEMRKTCGAESF